MVPPTRLVFPVGRSNGPFYEKPGADAVHVVQLGWSTFDLTWEHFQIWTLAHGVPPEVQLSPWTREVILKHAVKAGIDDPEPILNGLIADELLQEIELNSIESLEFAKNHRLMPQLFSLGNSSKKPWSYDLGLPGQPLTQVSPNYFLIWRYGGVSQNLWNSIEALVDAAGYDGQRDPGSTDPIIALNEILSGIHALVAAGCFYFDTLSIDWRDEE